MKIKGTIQELLDRGMKVNGVFPGKAELSVLTRLKIGKHVGEGDKPARGKTPKVYEFQTQEILKIEVNYENP